MEEQTNKTSAPSHKEKKKQKGERRRSSRQDEEIPESASSPPTDNAKEEIKKFKEGLLQSVSSGDSGGGQQIVSDDTMTSHMEIPQERERKRSSSRGPPASLSARSDLLADIDEAKLFELKEAFLLFDLDGDGCIDHNDLRGTLVSLGERVDEQAVRNMLSEASNPLDFDAFVTLLGYKTIELDAEETLIAALSRWDRDNSGLISEDRIRHDLMTWGDRFTEKEADYALEQAPVVQKGGRTMIDYIRFCNQLCGLRKGQKNENVMP